MEILKRNRGITLIALVITIIIMLILAGVAISSLGGENGLFANVKLAKEKYSISKAKEKLELKITELRLEIEGKSETLTKEHLPKINNDEIDVGSTEKFPVQVICDNHKFNVDENFIVTYAGEADGTIITYTTNPAGYTNKDEVKILIKVSNPNGIKQIIYPNGDKLEVDGSTEREIDYTVTANGTYPFKVIDIKNNEVEKDVLIDQIDREKPRDFTPTVSNIMIDGFTIIANAEDEEKTETSCKSGIAKYEYYINETKYESNDEKYTITKLNKDTTYNIYVIAYDRAGNSKKSTIIAEKTATKLNIPTAKITFNEENATTVAQEYPSLTLDGVMNCALVPNVGEKVTLEITSPETETISHLYSLDGGNTWQEYEGKVDFYYQSTSDNIIQVKSIYNNSEVESEVKQVKKLVFNNNLTASKNDIVPNEWYDRDFTTFEEYTGFTEKFLRVEPECIGKYITIYTKQCNMMLWGYRYEERNSGWFEIKRIPNDLTIGDELCAVSCLIPDCKWISFNAVSGTSAGWINYETWCSEEDLSYNIYSNDNKPW